jgi:hypothetical protein
MNAIPSIVHKCLNFPFENEIFIMHYSGFNHVSSHENFSLDFFRPRPIEPIKPHEDFFFLSYQNFKAKNIVELSLKNMPQHMIEPHILDETMIEPKYLPSNQDQPMKNTLPSTYKRLRDNQNNLVMPPKFKQVYKAKEKVV